MVFAALLSFALFAADAPAQTFQLAQIETTQAPAAEGPLQTGRSADDEIRAAAAAEGDPFPVGAPTDDYGFVAWCEGALAGHMALKPRVWPEVDRIERQFVNPDTTIEQVLAGYEQQQAEGQAALVTLDAALAAAEAKGLNNGVVRENAVAAGRETWRGADTAETRQLAQLWMSWSLPGRCMDTAKKIGG